MLQYDWENSVGYWICLTSHQLRKVLSQLLLSEGITLRQWEVLACLSCRECCSQAELADHLSIEPHTLAGVLKRMQDAGLLERRSCEADRRRNTLHPTPLADEVWQRVARLCHAMCEQVVSGITPEELDQFKSTCMRMQANIAAVAEDSDRMKAVVSAAHKDQGSAVR